MFGCTRQGLLIWSPSTGNRPRGDRTVLSKPVFHFHIWKIFLRCTRKKPFQWSPLTVTAGLSLCFHSFFCQIRSYPSSPESLVSVGLGLRGARLDNAKRQTTLSSQTRLLDCLKSLSSKYSISESFRMGTTSWDHLVQPRCASKVSQGRLHTTASHWVLSIFVTGDFKTSPWNLCQCLITFTGGVFVCLFLKRWFVLSSDGISCVLTDSCPVSRRYWVEPGSIFSISSLLWGINSH